MNLNTQDIDNAVNGKFTLFADAVKTVLKTKLSNSNIVKRYINDYDKIQQQKELFKQINNT